MAITIVGLGPGDGRLLTREAWQLLSTAETLFLRTSRHPAVADLPSTVQVASFDHLYETAANFEDVYSQIVARLLQQGWQTDIIYAVPGHPFIGESTVTQLTKAAAREKIAVKIVPGLSFVEPVLSAIQLDGLDGLQLFDAIEVATYHYPPLNPDAPVLLGQVYNRMLAGELKITLMAIYPDEHPVSLVHAAGTEQQAIEPLPLYAIDRSEQIDHLTALYLPPLAIKSDLTALAETVAVLRSPEGCPWDQEQTPQSMRSGFLEESSEVLAALDTDDPAGLCEELGDVLYHLVMQAQMAAEMEQFKLSDVIAGIEAKLKRRHPHVWGDVEVTGSDEVVRNWEEIKEQEKEGSTPTLFSAALDNIPLSLPALMRSQKVQQLMQQAGFDWPDISGVYGKLEEEIIELREADSASEKMSELGDVLFTVANLAHWLGVDAEAALREANLRFGRRVRRVEQIVTERRIDLTRIDLQEAEALWEEAKKQLAKTKTVAKVEQNTAGKLEEE